MKTNQNNSGQVVIVGLIIGLILFVSLVSLVNLVQVPIEEQYSEEEHTLKIDDDFSNLHASIISSGYGQEVSTISIDNGPSYEQGFILGSPFPKLTSLPPRGNISFKEINNKYLLEGNGNIELASEDVICSMPNATGPANCSTNTISFASDELKIDGGNVRYSIDYNHLDSITKVSEGNVYYEEVQNQSIVESNQNLIYRDNLKLTSLTGENFSREGISDLGVKTSPISSSRRSIPITNLDSIHIKSDLSVNMWENQTNPSKNINLNNVMSSSRSNYDVEFDLDPNEVYHLEVSKVGINIAGSSVRQSKQVGYALVYPYNHEVKNNELLQANAIVLDQYYNRLSGASVQFKQNTTNVSNTTVPVVNGSWVVGPNVTVQSDGKATGVWRASEDGVSQFKLERFGR